MIAEKLPEIALLQEWVKKKYFVYYPYRRDIFMKKIFESCILVISVVPHHWGDGFHFDSFPAILQAVFNKTHDMAMLNVMDGFSSGDYYYLSKNKGKWKFVKYRYGWMM